MSKETEDRRPSPPAPLPLAGEGGNAPDEHHGMGGSYVVDPKTGKRSLVERTAEVQPKEKE